ncbi:MAG: sigma-70 family RNA polymerase sigma factor, partial [Streptosporangiaceae bacterium]
ILHLRFFEGLTQSQIAEQVDISQMHVSRLLARALAHLRSKLLDSPEAADAASASPSAVNAATG